MLKKIIELLFGTKDLPKEPTTLPRAEKPKKDISEPVISFISALKANPKRFKIVWLNREEYINSIPLPKESFKKAEYVLVDRVSGEKFPFSQSGYDYYSLPYYLTGDEMALVKREVRSVFSHKVELLDKLRDQRASRGHQKERNRLKEIYCGNS